MADRCSSCATCGRLRCARRHRRRQPLRSTPGELHAIIGPNGAGKTTLIHQISGTLRSDSGTILFAGKDVTAPAMPQRVGRGLARSFQITSILPGFSALENVALAVQARRDRAFASSAMPRRRRR